MTLQMLPFQVFGIVYGTLLARRHFKSLKPKYWRVRVDVHVQYCPTRFLCINK